MVTCDYLIIGAGFAGIGLKYKLLGKTILIDKKPFQYKIGESHIPDLIHADPGLFSLIPKIEKMKSYTRKLGTVFCDSFHGRCATNLPTPLGERFTFHCEREEIEKLLAKELSAEIRQETILEIDLSKNMVKTDRNRYHFTKYLLDCSGPAMVIANKLGLVDTIDQFKGMKAQWSYWTIDDLTEGLDSWAQWTVLNKVASDSWVWQIPIYRSAVLSMGMLHRGEPLPDDAFIDRIQNYSAACYKLTSIARNPRRAIRPYMKQVHSRLHYSRRSRECSGKNWILVGDAYCFADPVYSVGSGVATIEAITIANNLNRNNGVFDHSWYEKKCNALLSAVIKGIGTWYSGEAFDQKVNQEVNETILRGGFARFFQESQITEQAKQVQQEVIDSFLLSLDQYVRIYTLKVYYFDRKCFVLRNGVLTIEAEERSAKIVNKNVRALFEDRVIGKKLSFHDLYLMCELHLRNQKDREYFWSMIRLIELMAQAQSEPKKMYYFHPELYEMKGGQLRLGNAYRYLMVKDSKVIAFFESLRAKILFEKELAGYLDGKNKFSEPIKQGIRDFMETFKDLEIFGQNYSLTRATKAIGKGGVKV